MNKLIYALLSVLALTSCAKQYSIQGSSNISDLDGRMLYLKAIKNAELKTIDSCEVVHGQFKFAGSVDSARMASIFMDDESVMPIVMEEGDIKIVLNNTQQSCSGTELNEKLYGFIDQYNKLQSQYADLSHKENQGIMNGEDMDAVYREITAEAERITAAMDKLTTGFIVENFENVLGPGIFMMITSGYEYPEFTPWVDDIMSKATDTFKNDSYVKQYIQAAERNQNIMNGMESPQVQPQAPLAAPHAIDVAPTPAQMAQPAQ